MDLAAHLWPAMTCFGPSAAPQTVVHLMLWCGPGVYIPAEVIKVPHSSTMASHMTWGACSPTHGLCSQLQQGTLSWDLSTSPPVSRDISDQPGPCWCLPGRRTRPESTSGAHGPRASDSLPSYRCVAQSRAHPHYEIWEYCQSTSKVHAQVLQNLRGTRSSLRCGTEAPSSRAVLICAAAFLHAGMPCSGVHPFSLQRWHPNHRTLSWSEMRPSSHLLCVALSASDNVPPLPPSPLVVALRCLHYHMHMKA